MAVRAVDVSVAIGHAPEELPLPVQFALAGMWAAFEIYTPENLALRKIAALGGSAAECFGQLRARGLDPVKFEFVVLKRPY